jgi:hypothetical protein
MTAHNPGKQGSKGSASIAGMVSLRTRGNLAFLKAARLEALQEMLRVRVCIFESMDRQEIKVGVE